MTSPHKPLESMSSVELMIERKKAQTNGDHAAFETIERIFRSRKENGFVEPPPPWHESQTHLLKLIETAAPLREWQQAMADGAAHEGLRWALADALRDNLLGDNPKGLRAVIERLVKDSIADFRDEEKLLGDFLTAAILRGTIQSHPNIELFKVKGTFELTIPVSVWKEAVLSLDYEVEPVMTATTETAVSADPEPSSDFGGTAVVQCSGDGPHIWLDEIVFDEKRERLIASHVCKGCGIWGLEDGDDEEEDGITPLDCYPLRFLDLAWWKKYCGSTTLLVLGDDGWMLCDPYGDSLLDVLPLSAVESDPPLVLGDSGWMLCDPHGDTALEASPLVGIESDPQVRRVHTVRKPASFMKGRLFFDRAWLAEDSD